MKKRVVVTGIGLVSPLGDDPEVAWKRLIEGESGISEIEDPELQGFRSRIAGQCKGFSPSQYVERKDEKKLERFAQFSYVSGIRAVEQSGIDFSKEDPFRCAVIVGCGAGGLAEIERQDAKLSAGGPSRVSPLTIPKIIINSASSLLAVRFGIHGVSYGVATACASANNAMIEAYKLIRDGDADVALTGGTEAAVCKLGLAGFSAMRALSARNETPEKASRPFDAYRDGFVLGEGAGMIVLEELEHAKKRGAAILGEIDNMNWFEVLGTIAGDNTIFLAVRNTGDAAEVAAIKRLFGDAAKSVSISSTKSAIGHLLGGSGGVEIIFSLMAIRDGVIPPTLNLEYPVEGFDLDFTPLVAKERKVDWAMSNSFGFGGHNACVIVARFVD